MAFDSVLTKITVIIPAFNAENTIRRALDSIACQTILPFEVIVVDDGSTDDTYKVAASHLLDGLTTFKVLRKENGGVASARNYGIGQSRSDYIALLDADDEFLPNHIEDLVAALGKYPAAKIVFSGAVRVFDSEEVSVAEKGLPDFGVVARKHCASSDESKFRVMMSTLFKDLIKGNFITTSSAMFPRTVDGREVLFDESLKCSEDRALFIKLASFGAVVFIDVINCRIHRGGGNISNRKNGKMHAVYAIKALDGVLKQKIFPYGAWQINEIKNEISRSTESLVYFSSQGGLYQTICAIKKHIKYGERFNILLCVKSIIRSIFSISV